MVPGQSFHVTILAKLEEYNANLIHAATSVMLP